MKTLKINKITRRSYKGKVYNMELLGDDSPEDDLYWIEQKTGIVTHNCFPKDICALIAQLESVNFDPKMLKACWDQNKTIRPEMDWGRSSSAVVSTINTE